MWYFILGISIASKRELWWHFPQIYTIFDNGSLERFHDKAHILCALWVDQWANICRYIIQDTCQQTGHILIIRDYISRRIMSQFRTILFHISVGTCIWNMFYWLFSDVRHGLHMWYVDMCNHISAVRTRNTLLFTNRRLWVPRSIFFNGDLVIAQSGWCGVLGIINGKCICCSN